MRLQFVAISSFIHDPLLPATKRRAAMRIVRILIVRALLIVLCMHLSLAPIAASDSDAYLSKARELLKSCDYAGCGKALSEGLKYARDDAARAGLLLLRSQYYLELRQTADSMADAAEAEKLYEKSGDPAGEFSAEILVVSSLFRRYEKVRGRAELKKLEQKLRPRLSQENLCDFFILRGELLQNYRDFELANRNYREALSIAKKIDDRSRATAAMYHMASLQADEKKFDEAQQTSLDALYEAQQVDSPCLVALVLEADGKLKKKASRFRDALTSFGGALAIYEKAGNWCGTGSLLSQIAGIYRETSEWDRSLEYEKKASVAFEKDPYARLSSLCQAVYLAHFLVRGDELDRLWKLFQESLPCCTVPYERAQALFQKGQLLSHIREDYPGGIESFNDAEKLFRSVGDRRGEVKCRVSRGISLTRSGKFDLALEEYRTALGICEGITDISIYDEDRFFEEYSPGVICRNIADTYYNMPLYQESIDYYRQAISRDADPDRLVFRILDRSGLIKASITTFNLDEAEQEIRQAFREIKDLNDADEISQAYIQIITSITFNQNLGGLESRNDIYFLKNSAGTGLMRKIWDDPGLSGQITGGFRDWITREQKNGKPDSEGLGQMFLGYFYFTGGKFTQARDSYEKAVELFDRGKTPLWKGLCCFFMSQLFLEEGKLQDAKNAARESKDIFVSAGLTDNHVNLLMYLGAICNEMGDHRESIEYLNDALQISRGSKSRRYYPEILSRLGYSYYAMKDYPFSKKFYDEALGCWESSGDRNLKATILAYLGKNHGALGEPDRALKLLEESFSEFRSLGRLFEALDVVLEMGAILEKQGCEQEALKIYASTLDSIYDVKKYVPFLRQEKQARSFPILEKAITLLIKSGRNEEALKYLEKSGSYEILNSLDPSLIESKDKRLTELMDKVGSLGKKMELLERDIGSQQDQKKNEYLSNVLASTRQEFFAVTNEIRAKNPDYGQLLSIQGAEIAELQRVIPADALLLEFYPSPNCLYIFLVSADSFSIRTIEVPRERLYELVRSIRAELSQGSPLTPAFEKNRHILYGYLIKGVKDEIDRKKVLLAIPSGLLWYVPIEILGDEEGRFLVEDHEIGYLYSSDILRLLAARRNKAETRLVAFGDPAGAELPLAKREAESIGNLFPGSRVFLGADATKEKFLTEAPSATILHIASHSHLDREDINRSYIQFSGGRLSLGEIYGVSLPDMSLVVLSSCESALGEENPGREFASLASAFTIAGSSSVIASLWKVHDESTALLLEEFYKNLKSGHSKSDALQLAKCALIHNPSTSHPSNWAGFMLLGDWR